VKRFGGRAFGSPTFYLSRLLRAMRERRMEKGASRRRGWVWAKRRLKLPSSKAAGSEATEAYHRGTSQGDARLRTKLEGSFSRR
jgi:hypothetical protein